MMKTIRVLGAIAFLHGLVSCQPAQQAWQAGQSEQAEPPVVEEPVQLSPAEQIEKISAALDDVKSELANAGKYSCCTFPTCNWSALHEGECSCYASEEAKKEVCPGCGLGWHNGNGMVDSFTAKDVNGTSRTSILLGAVTHIDRYRPYGG